MHRRHIGTAQQSPGGIFERRVRADQQDGPEADNKGQDIEVTDKTGGVEHAFAGLFSVAHGKETHQNMWQTGGTEHQRQPQRQRRNRVGNQTARAHDGEAFWMHLHGFGKQGVEVEIDRFHHHQRHKAGAGQ
ncbi:hypothetical protein D3C80_970330 [compost metagenome]